jgi:hypothetical protein
MASDGLGNGSGLLEPSVSIRRDFLGYLLGPNRYPRKPHAFDLNAYFLVCIFQIGSYFNLVEVEGGKGHNTDCTRPLMTYSHHCQIVISYVNERLLT